MPPTSSKVAHDDACDLAIELRNELVSYKKEQRATFWKKMSVAITVSLAMFTTGVGGCAYILDRTTAKFDEQRRTSDTLRDRISAEEKKSEKTEIIMQQLLEIQKESKADIRDIREAQHRIEISIANDKQP